MRLGVRAAPVFNKSFLKAEDAGVGNTEVRPWLACCSTWLSNASSNSDKGVDIWPPETAAIYSEKYIVKMSWGEKSSVLATPPPVSSSPLALPMPFCFFVLYAIDTGIRHQMVVLICSKTLSWESCFYLRSSTCDFQRPSLASPYPGLQILSIPHS